MNRLRTTLSGIVIAFTSVLILGCGKDKPQLDDGDSYQLEANLLMGNELFRSTLDGRDSQHAFEVLDIVRRNGVLEVHVQGSDHGGTFQFLWDGRVQESYPMGIRLILVYQGSPTAFDPALETKLSVNLQKIIDERNHIDDYHFYIINGSKIQTVTLNPDGTATHENK